LEENTNISRTYINLYNELRIKIKFLLIDYKKFYLDHKNNKKIIMYIIKQIKQINKEIWRNKKMIVSIKKIWINKEKYFQKIRKKKEEEIKKLIDQSSKKVINELIHNLFKDENLIKIEFEKEDNLRNHKCERRFRELLYFIVDLDKEKNDKLSSEDEDHNENNFK